MQEPQNRGFVCVCVCVCVCGCIWTSWCSVPQGCFQVCACVCVCYQLVLCFTPVVIRMCARERGEDRRRREIRGEDKRRREINKLPFNAYIIASFVVSV